MAEVPPIALDGPPPSEALPDSFLSPRSEDDGMFSPGTSPVRKKKKKNKNRYKTLPRGFGKSLGKRLAAEILSAEEELELMLVEIGLSEEWMMDFEQQQGEQHQEEHAPDHDDGEVSAGLTGENEGEKEKEKEAEPEPEKSVTFKERSAIDALYARQLATRQKFSNNEPPEEPVVYSPCSNESVENSVEGFVKDLLHNTPATSALQAQKRHKRRSLKGRALQEQQDIDLWVMGCMDRNAPVEKLKDNEEAKELFSNLLETFNVAVDESPAVLAQRKLRLRGLSMSAFHSGMDSDLVKSLPADLVDLITGKSASNRNSNADVREGTRMDKVIQLDDPGFFGKVTMANKAPSWKKRSERRWSERTRTPRDQRPLPMLAGGHGDGSSESSDEGIHYFKEVERVNDRADRYSKPTVRSRLGRKRLRTGPNLTEKNWAKLDLSSGLGMAKAKCKHGRGGRCNGEPATGKQFCQLHMCPSCGGDKSGSVVMCLQCSPQCQHTGGACKNVSPQGVLYCDVHACPKCHGDKSSLREKCHQCDPRCHHYGGKCLLIPVSSKLMFCPSHLCTRCMGDKSSLADLCHDCKPYCHHAGQQCRLAPLAQSFFCAAHACPSCGGDRPSNADLCLKCSHQVTEGGEAETQEVSDEELPPERARVYELSDSILHWQAEFVLAGDRRRVYLREDSIVKNERNKRNFILCNDVLVYTKVNRDGGQEYQGHLMLEDIEITQIGDREATISMERVDKNKIKTDSIAFVSEAARDDFLLALMNTPSMEKRPNLDYIVRLIDHGLKNPVAMSVVERTIVNGKERILDELTSRKVMDRLVEANKWTADDEDEVEFEDSPKRVRKKKIDACILTLLNRENKLAGREIDCQTIIRALSPFREYVGCYALPSMFHEKTYKHGYIQTPPPILTSLCGGRVIWIEGEAGIGRTSLLKQLARLCTVCNFTVAAVMLDVPQRMRPYFAWHMMLQQLLGSPSEQSMLAEARLLVPDEREERINLLTILFGMDHIDLSNDGAELRVNELLDTVYTILEAKAMKEPIVILIDDAHWMDNDSAYLLAYICERSAKAACKPDLQFILSARPVCNTQAALRRCRNAAELVHLFPLRQIDVEKSVMREVGVQIVSPHIVDFLYGVSAGLPSRLTELRKHLIESGMCYKKPLDPTTTALDVTRDMPSFEEYFEKLQQEFNRQQLLNTVSVTQRRLLMVAAVVGMSFSRKLMEGVVLLGAVGRISYGGLQNELHELMLHGVIIDHQDLPPGVACPSAGVESGVFDPKESAYSFADEAVMRTVKMQLQDAELRKIHRGIAEWFESLGPGNFDIAVAGTHFKEAKIISKATFYWEQLGREAALRLDLVEALRYFDQTLEMAASATSSLGEKRGSLPSADDVPAALLVPRVHLAAGNISFTLGQYSKALKHTQEALQLLGESTESSGGGKTAMRGKLSQLQFKPPTPLAKLLKEMAFPDSTTDAKFLVGKALMQLGELHANGRNREQSTGIIVKAVGQLERLGPSDDLALCYAQAAGAAATVGKFKVTAQYIAACKEIIEKYPPTGERELLELESQAFMYLGLAYTVMGNYGEAKQVVIASKAKALHVGHQWRQTAATILLSQLAFFMGNLTESLHLGNEALVTAVRLDNSMQRMDTMRSMVVCMMDLGDMESALRLLKEAQSLVAMYEEQTVVTLADLQCLSAQAYIRLQKYQEAAVAIAFSLSNLDAKRFKYTTFFALAGISEAVIGYHAMLISTGKAEDASKYQDHHKLLLKLWDTHGKNSELSKGRSNLYGGWYHLAKDKVNKAKSPLQKVIKDGTPFESAMGYYLLSQFSGTGPKDTAKYLDEAHDRFGSLGALFWKTKVLEAMVVLR